MTAHRYIYLIRHGEATHNQAGTYAGLNDTLLTPLGRQQARSLRDKLLNLSVDVCYVSPLARALETFHLALPDPQKNFKIMKDFREMHFGDFEGLTYSEICAAYPEYIQQWAEFREDFAFPGGECVADFKMRVTEALKQICLEAQGNILVFTHGGVIRFLLCELLKKSLCEYMSFKVPLASITTCTLINGVYDVQRVGGCDAEGVMHV